MEKLSLIAELRDVNTKTSLIRCEKKIPSVAYGHKFDAKAISVTYSEFLKVFRKGGKTHIIELSIEGKKQNVLIHDIQRHPVSGDFLHADFFVVSATEKIHVSIPLHLTGESMAQREGGMIEQNMHTLEIKCLPKDLVDAFEVDIAKLEKIGDVLHVSALGIDTSKFDILSPLEGAVVSAHAPKEIKEEEAPVVAASEVATVQDEKKAEKEAQEG